MTENSEQLTGLDTEIDGRKPERLEHREPVRVGTVAWLVAAAFVAAVIGVVYNAIATDAWSCARAQGIPFLTPITISPGAVTGGAANSGWAAAVLGISLWVAGGFVARRFQRMLVLLFVGFWCCTWSRS